MNMLEHWGELVRTEFGIESAEFDRDAVLDMTKNVAHGVARPAAPLTAYLLGVAVGQGYGLREAAARINALAEKYPGPATG